MDEYILYISNASVLMKVIVSDWEEYWATVRGDHRPFTMSDNWEILRDPDNGMRPRLFLGINLSMDKLSPAFQCMVWNYLSILKLQRCNRWSLGMDK